MASRLLRGLNICRYVSSRLPANSVPSSFARGRIPLGARHYSGWENSSGPWGHKNLSYTANNWFIPALRCIQTPVFWMITVESGYAFFYREVALNQEEEEFLRTSEKAEELGRLLKSERQEIRSLEVLLQRKRNGSCGSESRN